MFVISMTLTKDAQLLYNMRNPDVYVSHWNSDTVFISETVKYQFNTVYEAQAILQQFNYWFNQNTVYRTIERY